MLYLAYSLLPSVGVYLSWACSCENERLCSGGTTTNFTTQHCGIRHVRKQLEVVSAMALNGSGGLQVADALGDHCLGPWLDISAELITKKLLAIVPEDNNPRKRKDGHSKKVFIRQVSQPLLALPPCVQKRVFAALHAYIGSRFLDPQSLIDVLCCLLTLLPKPVHTMALAGAKSQEKLLWSMHVPSGSGAPALIQSFSSLARQPPALKALDVCIPSDAWSPPPAQGLQFEDFYPENSNPRAARTKHQPKKTSCAAQFASALQQHHSLTKLSLELENASPAAVKTYFSAVISLTALQHLYVGSALSAIHIPIYPNCFPALSQLLSNIPHLQGLGIQVGARKTEHGKPGAASRSSGCLASALSPATALTHLSLEISATLASPPATSLPSLQQLRLNFSPECYTWCQRFLANLVAPLSKLTCKISKLDVLEAVSSPCESAGVHSDDSGSMDATEPAADRNSPQGSRVGASNPAPDDEERNAASQSQAAATPALANCLTHLTALKTLVAFAHHESGIDDSPTQLGRDLLACIQAQPRIPGLPFQHLHTLHLKVNPQCLRETAPFLPASFPVLQHCSLDVDAEILSDGNESSSFEAQVWADIFQHIASMQLQSLRLRVSVYDPTPSGPWPVSALACLNCITGLYITQCESLTRAPSFEALTQMTRLKSLELFDPNLEEALDDPDSDVHAREFFPRLGAALSALTALKLPSCAAEVFASFAEAGGLKGVWPVLHMLAFTILSADVSPPMTVETVQMIARGARSHGSICELIFDESSSFTNDKDDVFQSEWFVVKWEAERIVAGSRVKVLFEDSENDASDDELKDTPSDEYP